MRAGIKRRAASVMGRKFFHVRDISWSYRRRGRDARTQTKRLANTRVEVGQSRKVSGVA